MKTKRREAIVIRSAEAGSVKFANMSYDMWQKKIRAVMKRLER